MKYRVLITTAFYNNMNGRSVHTLVVDFDLESEAVFAATKINGLDYKDSEFTLYATKLFP